MLTSVELKNFKSFRSATVPLGPFTLLVGTNASGKSNLRDAFRFLHGIGRGYSLAEIIDEKYGEGGERQWAGIRGGAREVAFAGEHRFTVGAALTTTVLLGTKSKIRLPLRYSLSVALDDAITGPYAEAEALLVAGRARFSSDHVPQQDHEHIKVMSQSLVRVQKRLTFISSTPVLTQAARKHPADFGTASRVLPQLHSMRFLDLSPDAMRIPSLPGQPILGDRGERLSSALLAICRDAQKKRTLLEWIRALTPLDVVDLDFPEDFSGRVLVHLVERGGRKISAHSASDGTLRFLAMVAALLDDASKLYFIEEIENGIHPTRLHLLVQLIEQQCRSGRVQVVATTHSPQLLGFLSPESRQHALLVYRLKDADDSRVKPILELPQAKEVLETQDLGRLHAAGWLEDMVELMSDEPSEAAE
jgi:predicted ATPase